jgi:hypothetical protein
MESLIGQIAATSPAAMKELASVLKYTKGE